MQSETKTTDLESLKLSNTKHELSIVKMTLFSTAALLATTGSLLMFYRVSLQLTWPLSEHHHQEEKAKETDLTQPLKNAAGKKKERVESAPVHDQISADAANQVSFSGADQVPDAGVGQTVVNNSQDQDGGKISKN